MKKLLFALSAVVCIGISTSAAYAADAGGPCAADVKKFCADVKSGEGRTSKCLNQHATELSDGCKASRAAKKKGKGKKGGTATPAKTVQENSSEGQ